MENNLINRKCQTERNSQAMLPRKKFFRARAHCNPLSDSQFSVPLRPDKYDWRMQYPTNEDSTRRLSDPQVKFVDVGCGFGGLLVKIAPVFPEHFAIGFEIRDKVSQYVKERCKALRKCNHGLYEKISCIRTNSMKFLPNYFRKGQLSKLFFLFPDPHFKTANHRRRIIQRNLLAEYAYALHNGGLLYTITDVEELGSWMADKISAHPCFRQLNSDEIQNDQVVPILFTGTEEVPNEKQLVNAGLVVVSDETSLKLVPVEVEVKACEADAKKTSKVVDNLLELDDIDVVYTQ